MSVDKTIQTGSYYYMWNVVRLVCC